MEQTSLRRVVPSQRFLVASIILSLGIVLSSIHLWHLVSHEKPLVAQVVGAVIPLCLALGVVYAGYWTFRSPWSGQWMRYLSLWTVLGALVMGGLAGLLVLHQSLAGVPLDDAPFMIATAATGGALGGFLIGLTESRHRRKAERIETIHEATRKLMTAHTTEDVCHHAVELAADGLDMSLTGVWLYDDDEGVLDPVATTATGDELFGEHPVFEADNSISWRVYQEGEPRYIPDVASHPDVHNSETPVRSELLLPLDDHGILNIGSQRVDAFDAVDVTTAKILASTTTAALDRAKREEALRTQRQELKQQAAQLEDFARTVSHDLRNPLNVASLRLELTRDTGDLTHLADAETALDRMENIIQDILWLAREGQRIGEKEAVSLEEIARAAWSFVDTQHATLRCDCDWQVCADTDRLQQLFENLFHNAIQHGGPDVTVTVGTFDNGFYVEDTGAGIPASDRDAIFEAGYSTSHSGTGFGLAIVDDIVDAHGWEIVVTDGADGGARFEIATVEAVDEGCCAQTATEL